MPLAAFDARPGTPHTGRHDVFQRSSSSRFSITGFGPLGMGRNMKVPEADATSAPSAVRTSPRATAVIWPAWRISGAAGQFFAQPGRSNVVDVELHSNEMMCGRGERPAGAPQRGIEKGGHQPAMRDAHRPQVRLVDRDFECRPSFFDGDGVDFQPLEKRRAARFGFESPSHFGNLRIRDVQTRTCPFRLNRCRRALRNRSFKVAILSDSAPNGTGVSCGKLPACHSVPRAKDPRGASAPLQESRASEATGPCRVSLQSV